MRTKQMDKYKNWKKVWEGDWYGLK